MVKKKIVLRRDNSLALKISEAKDIEGHEFLHCVIFLDGNESGRTRTIVNPQWKKKKKKGDSGQSFWVEDFLFSNLHPHFQVLQLLVYGKTGKNESCVGMVQIPRDILLTACDKEEWFPLRETEKVSSKLGEVKVVMEAQNSVTGPILKVSILEGRSMQIPPEQKKKNNSTFLATVMIIGDGEDTKFEFGEVHAYQNVNPKFEKNQFSTSLGPEQANHNICITVYSTDGSSKTPLGNMILPLKMVQTGIKFDSWYPLIFKNKNGFTAPVGGRVRMKIKYQENVVLPTHDYKPLWHAIEKVPFPIFNALNSVSTNKEESGTLLLRLFGTQNCSRYLLRQLVELDLENTDTTKGAVLFRANSITTKAIEAYIKHVGFAYLKTTLGPNIEEIITQKKCCEVNPSHLARGSNLKKNFRNLEQYVRKIADSILNSVSFCPAELRGFFFDLRKIVSEKIGAQYRHTSISAFLFLRFLGPAIMGPYLFGLVTSFPTSDISRTLTLVAKSVQSLASLVLFENKEEYMKPMNAFLEEYSGKMKKFLDEIGAEDTREHQFSLDEGKEFACLYRHVSVLRPQLQEHASSQKNETNKKTIANFVDTVNILSALHMAYRRAGQMRFIQEQPQSLDQNSVELERKASGLSINKPEFEADATADTLSSSEATKESTTAESIEEKTPPTTDPTTNTPVADSETPEPPIIEPTNIENITHTNTETKVTTANITTTTTPNIHIISHTSIKSENNKEKIINVLHNFTSEIVNSVSLLLAATQDNEVNQFVPITLEVKKSVHSVCEEMLLVDTSNHIFLVENLEELKTDVNNLVFSAEVCLGKSSTDHVDLMMMKAYQILRGTKALVSSTTGDIGDNDEQIYDDDNGINNDSINKSDSDTQIEESDTIKTESAMDYKHHLDSIALEIEPPIGMVSFVCTGIDITSLGMDHSLPALKIHNDIFRRLLREFGGYEVSSQGGEFTCAFSETHSAVKWAFQVQLRLLEADWPLQVLNEQRGRNGEVLFRGPRIRMGIHRDYTDNELDYVTGRMEYSGPTILATKTLRDGSAGGQILICENVWNEIDERIKPELNSEQASFGQIALSDVNNAYIVQINPKELANRQFTNPNDDKKEVSMIERKRMATRYSVKIREQVFPEGHVAVVYSSIKNMEIIRERNLTAWLQAISSYDEILRKISKYWHGYDLEESDGVFKIVFQCVSDAVAYSLMCQEKLREVQWPADILDMEEACEIRGGPNNVVVSKGLKAKIGLDFGPVVSTYNKFTSRMQYTGNVVDRAGGLGSIADGGQIVISKAAMALVSMANLQELGANVKELGSFRITNESTPETISQLSCNKISFYDFVLHSRVTPRATEAEKTNDFTELMTIMKQYDEEGEVDASTEISIESAGSPSKQREKFKDRTTSLPLIQNIPLALIKQVTQVERKSSLEHSKNEPRICYECRKMIADDDYDWLSVCGKFYHNPHFRCHVCHCSLTNQHFMEGVDKHMYCINDYEKTFGEICCVCKEVIGPNELCIRACGKVYHENHFNCNICKKSLVGQVHVEQYGEPYCQEDFNEVFTELCAACSKPVADTEYIEAIKQCWHIECFKCQKCNKLPTEGDRMFGFQDYPICQTCYEPIRREMILTKGRAPSPTTNPPK